MRRLLRLSSLTYFLLVLCVTALATATFASPLLARSSQVGRVLAPDVPVAAPYLTYSDGLVTRATAQGAILKKYVPTSVEDPDPDLEPGFPVYTDGETAGTYHGASSVFTLVGNIDSNPDLEIIASSLANGPLYAWKANGSRVAGWPAQIRQGVGYPALGHLAQWLPGFQTFSAHYPIGHEPSYLFGYDSTGNWLPGWPRTAANFVRMPPALADVDGDGLDEIFLEEEDWRVHGYHADGSVLPGWPVSGGGGSQERNTPAIADLDGDHIPEVLFTSGPTNWGTYVSAFHHDGAPVAGFPVYFPSSQHVIDAVPSIGDVDGDGQLEIVIFLEQDGWGCIKVLGANGTVERTIVPLPFGEFTGATNLALADLDADGRLDIVMQGIDFVLALHGDGTVLPGWPRQWNMAGFTNSAPVVGDVDGDGQVDVVVVSSDFNSSGLGYVRAYDRLGNSIRGFPKTLPMGWGAMPAIADIDLDGRNEIIINGSAWDGGWTLFPKIWVYDLHGPGPYGGVPWGQYGGGPKHQGTYYASGSPPPVPVPPRCPGERFHDVCPGDYFYTATLQLNDASIVSGYNAAPPCPNNLWIPCFLPYNNVTRGQVSKIVALSAAFNDNITAQSFQDVAPGSTFFAYIGRLYARGIISGYPCGTSGEPCVPPANLPYFRPGTQVSRGQLSKMTSLAFGYAEGYTNWTFQDVPVGSTFYVYIQRLASRTFISGYPCGGSPQEPCVAPDNRPYFRPSTSITRGQTAKIVYNAWTAPRPTGTATPTSTNTPTATPTVTQTVAPPTDTAILPTQTPTEIATGTVNATSTPPQATITP